MGIDTDGHANALLALECLGHRGNTERGKPPPPTVSFVRHAGDVAVPERVTPAHIIWQEAGRAEARAVGGGGGKGGHLMDVQRLWAPP